MHDRHGVCIPVQANLNSAQIRVSWHFRDLGTHFRSHVTRSLNVSLIIDLLRETRKLDVHLPRLQQNNRSRHHGSRKGPSQVGEGHKSPWPNRYATIVENESLRLAGRDADMVFLRRFERRCHTSQSRIHGRHKSKHHSEREGPRYDISSQTRQKTKT